MNKQLHLSTLPQLELVGWRQEKSLIVRGSKGLFIILQAKHGTLLLLSVPACGRVESTKLGQAEYINTEQKTDH